MFDVTPDEISQLNDTDLRELVGRLCEAEMTGLGLSPAAVTWGGSQTAADGGLDVRVSLPLNTSIDGFIARRSTGFQVKKPDMPRAEILDEMRPFGTIRPVIQEIADEVGSYIIISSQGSIADSALKNRRKAMREALDGVNNADQLHTDFYDRTRLASWVRCHPGLTIWVKEKVGRSLVGWRPFGSWSSSVEGPGAEYLLDDKLRLRFAEDRGETAQPVGDAIDRLRDELAKPNGIVRLVGLSGVGKTRLVQALFDARIGSRPLPASEAVYTNLSDDPNPQPIALASDLLAIRMRAILIIDNCPPELHRRLSELCSRPDGIVSVLTVEYDVRDDQPEGTQVVTLDTFSNEVLGALLLRRYPNLSSVDSRTIAEYSGGNARIALAIAATIGRSESIAVLSDEDVFQRLFRQRHQSDDALLQAALACSLVYSFQGEALTGNDAEMPRLAALVGQTPEEVYRHVSELLRRELVQQRSVWRAVLPHAMANRLAARALEDIPYELIDRQLLGEGSERLARSFSRRLAYLHDHPRAIAIVEKWLAPEGLLGTVANLNDLGQAMLENVAPVSPEATLTALLRAGSCELGTAMTTWERQVSLLRSLAYEPSMFERVALVLADVGTLSTKERTAKEATETFVSLFTLHLSGTHATIDQRLRVIESLLRSEEPSRRSLGLAALDNVLETTDFCSPHSFEFGARSRNYGYSPQNNEDIRRWYSVTILLIERLAVSEILIKLELSQLVAKNFRGLWLDAELHEEMESLSKIFSREQFWYDGWAQVREMIYLQLDTTTTSRLVALETSLRPRTLQDRIRALVIGGNALDDVSVVSESKREYERLEACARDLGSESAADNAALSELLPELLSGGTHTWSFGRGLACASVSPQETWEKLTAGLKQIRPDKCHVGILRGFLAWLWEHDNGLVHSLLDLILEDPALAEYLPEMHSLAVKIDQRSLARLKAAMSAGQFPSQRFRALAMGRTADCLPGNDLNDLLLLIANQPSGCDVALEILQMRFYTDRSEKRAHEPELLEAGRELLLKVKFRKDCPSNDYRLAELVRTCLMSPDSSLVASAITKHLKQADSLDKIYVHNYRNLVKALIQAHPMAVLDEVFAGSKVELDLFRPLFSYSFRHTSGLADDISCETLIAWCDQDPCKRYPIAASIVTFSHGPDIDGHPVWSDQARILISKSPDPEKVLLVFVSRFRPMSWIGSRARLMEANARLLDSAEIDFPFQLMEIVAGAKAQLARDIANERQWETERDRAQDERFEW